MAAEYSVMVDPWRRIKSCVVLEAELLNASSVGEIHVF
jgi:hypothetical protein